jgi:hypothetical protein
MSHALTLQTASVIGFADLIFVRVSVVPRAVTSAAARDELRSNPGIQRCGRIENTAPKLAHLWAAANTGELCQGSRRNLNSPFCQKPGCFLPAIELFVHLCSEVWVYPNNVHSLFAARHEISGSQ